MGKRLYILIVLMLGLNAAFSQQVPAHPPIKVPEYGPHDTIIVYATVMPDGTLVPTSALPWVEVIGKMPRWLARQNKQMTRLRNAVYVTYPYAREASRVINTMNFQLARMTNESQRKEYIKNQEKELKRTFGDRITNLSVYQGKVLMKLINRQTGTNVFEILKEYKGGFNARFWQTIAFVFGSSLKQPYDPKGADAEMEGYVKEVQLLYGTHP